jgi:hypothetical protein
VLLNAITDPLTLNSDVGAVAGQLYSKANIYCSAVATKVDNTGASLDDTATAFAGYKYTVTVRGYRPSNIRVLPKIVPSGVTAGTFASSVTSVQGPSD